MVIGILIIGIKKWKSRQQIEPSLQLNIMPMVNFSNQISNNEAEHQTEDTENLEMPTISRSISVQPTIPEMEAIDVIEILPNAGMLIEEDIITHIFLKEFIFYL